MKKLRGGLTRLVGAAALALAVTVACTTPPTAPDDTQSALYTPDLTGIRWGYLVTDLDGEVIASHSETERFSPASNTKLFTTAAAFEYLRPVDRPDPGLATEVYLQGGLDGRPGSLVLKGAGDALLSSAADCEVSCLSELADAVVAAGILSIGDVIGDDTLFPHERWGPGWSFEDLETYNGTAVSALSLDDNRVRVEIAPGPQAGAPVTARLLAPASAIKLRNDAMTSPAGESDFEYERAPGSTTLRLYGTIALSERESGFFVGIEDPALYAAARFADMLRARGVRITGEARARHRPLQTSDDPENRDGTMAELAQAPGELVAALPVSPLDRTLTITNERSNNLHAELLLRRLGLMAGTGSRADGVAMIDALLERAGGPPRGYDFSDGSGMSIYNRVSPETMVDLLTFAAAQDWGEAWRETFPVGGGTGTLRNRFRGTALEGRIFAKTGTLRGVNALSGYLEARSGRMLAFSIFANDRPSASGSALDEMDAFLIGLAEAN